MDGGPNFDVLDIESSSVEDFKGQEHKLVDYQEDSYLLKNQTVLLDDGRRGYVFTFLGNGSHIFCHICQASLNGWSPFNLHVSGKKHTTGMQKSNHPATNFSRFPEMETSWELQPGEPAPPGMEEFLTEKCNIQPKLDAIKTKPLIGLEYLYELTADNMIPSYCCFLCNKHGPENNIIVHLSSQQHYLKYLQNFFPLVNSALSLVPKTTEYKKGFSVVLSRIIQKIEDKHGRLKPKQHALETFNANKSYLTSLLDEEYHFRETIEDDYVNMVDWTEIKKLQFYNEDAENGSNSIQSEAAASVDAQQEPIEDTKNKSLFNKTGRINVEKRNLRKGRESFEDDSQNKSSQDDPDLIVIGETKLDPVNVKKRVQSDRKSLSSISTISSDSLQSVRHNRKYSRSRSRSTSMKRRNNYRRYSRSHSRSSGRRRYASPNRHRRLRSRSPPYKRYHRKSRSRSRSRGRYNRYRRDRSPVLPYPRRHRSPSLKSRSRSRSRTPASGSVHYVAKNKLIRKPTVARQDEPEKTEKQKLEQFVEELKEVVESLEKKLKYYEKNPEKHPQYRDEWKSFWNLRYKELQGEGKDPAKHDFKPEWIIYWNKRMRELHEEQLRIEKENLKQKVCTKDNTAANLSGDKDEVKKDVTVDDIKNTWKALTGSDIKETIPHASSFEDNIIQVDHESRLQDNHLRNRPPPGARLGFVPFDDNAPRVVSVLRLVSVLESQIGSLGPKVVALLSKAIAMEKSVPGSSQEILCDEEHSVLFETVKEKLKGLWYAGLVDRNFVNTTKVALRHIDDLIQSAPKIFKRDNRSIPMASASVSVSAPLPVPVPVSGVPSAPVTVPGIGTVDRVAIAQQIATALIAQGKTDVTENELEQLINAVVGMAQASNSSGPITAAEYMDRQCGNIMGQLGQVSSTEQPGGGLKLLQTAYNEENKDAVEDHSRNETQLKQARNCLNSLFKFIPDKDLKLLVEHFEALSSNEKNKLVNHFKNIQNTDPGRILTLQKIVNLKFVLGFEDNKQTVIPSSEISGTTKNEVANDAYKTKSEPNEDDDDDVDDYSVEDVYKAASENLRQQELTQEREKLDTVVSSVTENKVIDDPTNTLNNLFNPSFIDSKFLSGLNEVKFEKSLESPHAQHSGRQDYVGTSERYQAHNFQQSNLVNPPFHNPRNDAKYDGDSDIRASYSYNSNSMASSQQLRLPSNPHVQNTNYPHSMNMENINRYQPDDKLPPRQFQSRSQMYDRY